MSSRLLVILTEDINIPAGLVSNVRSVVATTLLAQLRDLGDLLVGELNLLEVIGDTRRRDGFGDDTDATDLGPGEDDVGAADGVADTLGDGLGDFLDFGAVDEEGDSEAVVSEGLGSVSIEIDGVGQEDEVRVLRSRQ